MSKKKINEQISNEKLTGYINAYDYYIKEENVADEYYVLSRFYQDIFLGKYGYLNDTGNSRQVNLKLMKLVKEKIEKHPVLWKLFFMIR